VTVVPFGINNAVPQSPLTPAEARARLGIAPDDRVLLFFGNIAPYKGLEYLAQALPRLLASSPRYRLVVAGPLKPGCDDYWNRVQAMLTAHRDRVVVRAQFIPDEDVEIFCKAADVLVLPYVHIFQSGVLFLGFSFGLPALVADVGSLKDDIIEGETGFSFQPRDVDALVDAVIRHFDSELAEIPDDVRRRRIVQRAEATHSWDTVAAATVHVYSHGDLAASR
jgi:glycosyltransferase involved in cell wall biosynthesis